MLLRILVLWLLVYCSYSKADICLPNTEGLCEPGVNITEDVQVEITEEDLGTEIVTTTTTTTTTTTIITTTTTTTTTTTNTTKSSSEPVTMFESPQDIKHPFSITSPTGEVKSGDDSLKQIISVFDEFLPQCISKDSVIKFWKDNKVGLSLIEEKNFSEFKRLQKDFKDKKDTFN